VLYVCEAVFKNIQEHMEHSIDIKMVFEDQLIISTMVQVWTILNRRVGTFFSLTPPQKILFFQPCIKVVCSLLHAPWSLADLITNHRSLNFTQECPLLQIAVSMKFRRESAMKYLMELNCLFRFFSFALCSWELNSRLFPCAGPSKSGIVVLSPYHHDFAGEVDEYNCNFR
jgi:hypothetical protein